MAAPPESICAKVKRGRWNSLSPTAPLERIAFIRIRATHANLLISHVREAQNRFPLLRDML